MKLWDKGVELDGKIEKFTIGADRELDIQLAPFDILGSIAHCKMLLSIGILSSEEEGRLLDALRELYHRAAAGEFRIEEGEEDVHSQVESLLTEKLGDLGRKIHTARSRNDQVLLDLKLFIRDGIEKTVEAAKALFDSLQEMSSRHKDVLMPGYTHLQVAMPSSFGLWFGAYAESLVNDLVLLKAAWDVSNRNPLGSAAGYGSSIPVDRSMTARLLGFDGLDYNSVYAQMTRGKTELTVAFALSAIASTVSRFAYDCCLFNGRNFGFITLPDSLTTGSSIMPHKKNPDVFELLRAKCNRIASCEQTIRSIISNLPSGYFRDMQEVKAAFMPIFGDLAECLEMAKYAVENIRVEPSLMEREEYRVAFSVEEANRLVTEGMPFRSAYRKVAEDIANGTFSYDGTLRHTHEGSIGNLCNDRIAERMEGIVESFRFDVVHKALDSLV